MSTPEEEEQEGRRKHTILLLTVGAVVLVLPLLGIIYIRMNEAKAARPPNSSMMFDRRENGETKVNLSQPGAIIDPDASSLPVAGGKVTTTRPAGSSLDFVKGGANLQNRATAAPAAPAAPTPAAAPEPEPESEPAPKSVAKKGGKKAFNMPKLQGTTSFSSFKGASPKPTGDPGMTGVADPAGKGGGEITDMLKNVPGGTDNPEVQKYLKSQGK